MTVAVYPGSFDPITNGHLEVAIRAAKIFERVVIGVYATPAKNLLFTADERVDLIRQSITAIPNLEVQSFHGLTVEFARKVGAGVMVRGLRMTLDFEHEFDMAMMNKKLYPELELVCFMSTLRYQFLSSSLLKEVASLGGNVSDLVPKHVADAVLKKFEMKRKAAQP